MRTARSRISGENLLDFLVIRTPFFQSWSLLKTRGDSVNWVRDVTFGEDSVKTKAGNQAQIMGSLHGLAIELIRKTSPKNFKAAIEKFSDVPGYLESILLRVKFL